MSEDEAQYGPGRIKVAFTVGGLAFQGEGDAPAVLAAQRVYLDWLRDRHEVVTQMAALCRPTGGGQ